MNESNAEPYRLPTDGVWFITGCSSGIGQSLAQLIAKSPGRIVATARNITSLSAIIDGPNVLKLALDVTSTSSIEVALSETLTKFGRIDVVVNNAGYTLVGDTEAAGDEESRALFDTNFWGMVDVAKKAIGIMRDENARVDGQQGGVILNISSMGGFMGFPGSSFYHASKFAMEGWTEAVAKELPVEWNIHLCNIEPGGVKTNYATSSLKTMANGRHPAYADPTHPTNVLLGYMGKEENRSSWAEPDAIAAAMYRLVSRGQRIPIRVPLGADAYGMITMDIESIRKDLDEFKEISLSKYRPVVQLQKLPLGFSDGGWASGWILTLCVQAGLQAYVRKKTQEEPSLVHGVDSHPLLFCALLLPLSTGHEIFQSYNLEMLGLLLKVGTNPNQNHLNTSIWGVFLSQCYIKRQYIAKVVERVLAQVFTLLVKHGAEPEAKIETGKSSEKATFSGRIMKYSVYTSVSEIIEACCPDEVHNFRVVIEKQRGYSILKWIGWNINRTTEIYKSVGTLSRSFSEMSVDSDYTPEFSLGMRPETKQLYRPDDRSTWDEWNPGNVRTDAEAGSFAQECALIVRREPHPSNNNQAALHSITVQSPLIKKVLEGTFQGFEGLNMQLKQLTFKAPFHPFYYRWHRFEKLRQDEQDQNTKNHLDLLYAILSKEILPHIEVMEDLTKNKVISFDYLWTIFSPGMEVYTKIDGHDRIVLLRDSRYGANMSGEYFSLEFRYIDCDGLRFGYVETSLEINSFDGVKKLVDLDAFPSHIHPDVEGLVRQLYARGNKLTQLNGFHHMSYSGFYTARSSRQVRKRHVESGRIIIDPHTFNIYGMPGPNLESVETDAPTASADDELFGTIHNVIYKATSQAFQEYESALKQYEKHGKGGSSVQARALGPKQLLLCTPIVRGYCLTSKSWAEFDIENVGPIRWSENSFARLVLPHGYKDIIHAFVQEQLSRDDGFDDIISGKGLGFIMLLSGDPGVGKTLTAESVAEEMHQPLYSMSAGELGETAAEVEDSLELVLELTSKWNAILLLDECDMFLEARTTADIRRNRLISIFLKKLEYYRGVMFLTSNRISDFDPAFESRIHLTVHYPALDTASRLHIWKTFVRMGNSDSRLSDKDLATLAKNEINGRQIKNIIKTGRLLSKQQKVPLGMEHVEMVLKVKRGDFR
ncbi:hypothetical protein V496_08991 [Pseudogymnoascus sp. VKM F-4515 (FW-2607)]|nr:hypothetical protein V496_08991 [Pseudogymnoascus sp. VKM F-4515 (FW-2607)]